MNRLEYYRRRSEARHAVRVADIRFETDPPFAQIEADRRMVAWFTGRVPGGLTSPFKYVGFGGLLPEWHARRNAVREQIRQRHIAERERALPTIARRAA